jgi:hypothetical protein
MTVNRRKFVQSSLFGGAGLLLNPFKPDSIQSSDLLLGIDPFILQNPDAVFIMKTDVDQKTNAEAIRSVGLDFGRSVFGLTDNAADGIPLSHKFVIKPNLTCRMRSRDIYTQLGSMGIVTDAFFVEGIIESMKELSVSAEQIYIREVNCPDDLADGGYIDMASRTGIDLKGIDTPAANLSAEAVHWVDVPDGVWFKKIPYLWPVNTPDSFLLNISKFKAHSMGLTLCAKNLQGTIAMNYQAHCTSYGTVMAGVKAEHVRDRANLDILVNYDRHLRKGVPRWDKPESNGGLWQETWATRCLDNNSVTFAGLHIIEGIYGRDGNFLDGPDSQNMATDYMTNYIIFGRNQFYVDIIGHYLGGHEPGNFGLFHMAKERGMITTINPANIPVYEWRSNTGPLYEDLNTFTRYPLKTLYLQKNYNGYSEPKWHLVNEPYDYSTTGIDDVPSAHGFYLQQNFPNPVTNTTSINFSISSGGGHVSLEILNKKGQVIDLLVNKQLSSGSHTIIWNSSKHPEGLYFCRMKFGTSSVTRKMIVVH